MSLRDPLFGKHGRKVVASLCTYEVVALNPAVPLPTLSEIVSKRGPWGKVAGIAMLAALAHHWFFEMVEEIEEMIEASTNFEFG